MFKNKKKTYLASCCDTLGTLKNPLVTNTKPKRLNYSKLILILYNQYCKIDVVSYNCTECLVVLFVLKTNNK